MTKRIVYTIGGSVQSGGGVYITRRADEQLLQLCQDSQFAYVLAHRQCGKSSLMHRTAEELVQSGVRAVRIDLSGIGTKGGSNQSSIEEDNNQLLIDQWYFSLLTEIEDELSLTTDVVEWWQQHAELLPTDRLVRFFREVVLQEISSPVVIFLDEIDTTLEFNFRGDFFAALRYLYQDRVRHPELNRLSFVLIGVAIPSELINDPQRTPFNIGRGIDLTDFTFEEALPLADGLGLPTRKSQQVLRWVLDWTGGHPFLTQGLCQALVDSDRNDWSKTDVDAVVHETFLGAAGDRNPHLQFIRRFLLERTPDVTAALTTYQQIRNGWQSVFDEEQSSVKSHLKLSGVVRRDEGRLKVRNRIYRHVFNARWINENLPLDDRIRQLRRTFLIAAGIIAVILPTPFAIWAEIQRQEADHQRTNALKNAREAKEQTKIAQVERRNAEEQTRIAQVERRNAEEQTRIAQVERRNAEDQTLVANQQKANALENAREAEEQTRIAQVERRNAEDQTLVANQQRQEAGRQRNEANRQRDEADQQRQTVEIQRQGAELREMAARALNLLSSQNPTDGLVQAIATIQRNSSYFGGQKILQPVQHSLFTAIDTVREKNIFSHSDPIYAVAISPNNKLTASLNNCGFLTLWNNQGQELSYSGRRVNCTDSSLTISSPRETDNLTEVHTDPVTGSIAFSKDSQLIVSSGSYIDGLDKVNFWYLQGDHINTTKSLSGHQNRVSSVAISRDSQIVVSGSWDKTVRLWDRQGNPIGQSFEGHEGEVTSVAVTPNGQLIASGSTDRTIRLWDRQGNLVNNPFRGHEDVVTSVAFNPHGQYRQDQINGNLIDDENVIVSGSKDGTIRLWNLQGEPIGQPLRGHEGTITAVAFSPDGRTIVSASVDQTIRQWDRLGNPIGQPLHGSNVVTSFSISADGQTLVSGSLSEAAYLWDLQGRQIILSSQDEGSVDSVAISANGQSILGSSASGREARIRIWQLQNNEINSRLLTTSSWTNPISFIISPLDIFQATNPRCLLDGRICIPELIPPVLSPNGQFAIFGDSNNVVIADIQSQTLSAMGIRLGQDNITDILVSADNQMLGIVVNDRDLRLWDISNYPEITSLGRVHLFTGDNKLHATALSADRSTLAVSLESRSDSNRNERSYSLLFWDINATGFTLPKVIGLDQIVPSLAISADGQIIAGGVDKTVQLWNRQGETIGNPFQGHEQSINSVAVSADGQIVVSGGADQTVRAWNREGSEIVPPLRGHRAPVRSVAISADGKTVVSGSEDRTVRLWQIGNWQDWLQVGCNRLHYHPVFQHPENSFDPAVTQEARAACEQLVWHRMNFGSR